MKLVTKVFSATVSTRTTWLLPFPLHNNNNDKEPFASAEVICRAEYNEKQLLN